MREGEKLSKEKKYKEANLKFLEAIKNAEPEDDFETLALSNFKLGKLAFHHFKDLKKAESYLLEFQIHSILIKKRTTLTNLKNKEA